MSEKPAFYIVATLTCDFGLYWSKPRIFESEGEAVRYAMRRNNRHIFTPSEVLSFGIKREEADHA